MKKDELMRSLMDISDSPTIRIDGVEGEYKLMDGSVDDLNGPVCTQEEADSFIPGFGHMIDGQIWRYGVLYCDRSGWDFVEDE